MVLLHDCLNHLFPFFSLFIVSYSAKLSTPRLLLPYLIDKPTGVLLEAADVSRGGCFKWIASEPQHAMVSPVYSTSEKNCSRKAIVSGISTSSRRHVSYILAVPEGTPENSVSCEIITDSINSISLVYPATSISLDSPPDVVTVIGKNTEGDTFSSLNGMEFEWTLNTVDSSSQELNVLRFIKFSDSLYTFPSGPLDWDIQDLHSSSILIESLNVGSATVTAKLKNSIYSDVNEGKVIVTVVSNIRLNPSGELYVLSGSAIPFKLEAVRQGKATEVLQEDYDVKVKNSEIVSVDEQGSVVALKTGSTVVFVEDIYNKSTLHSCDIHVVQPSFMVLDVSPGNRWALKEVGNYEVYVRLYDSNHHELYLPPNIRVQVSFPNRLFYINSTSPNGTHHSVRTVVAGSGSIRAELRGFENAAGALTKSKSISASQKIVIYQSVQIIPPFVMVPWDNVFMPEYVVHLKASGGTGVYLWSSTNSSIAHIEYQPEESSQVIVYVHGVGDIIITATDRHNPTFSATMKLSSQPIVEIEVNPTVVEASVGNNILIPLALLGYEDKGKKILRVFDDCSKIKLYVDVVDNYTMDYIPDADMPPFGRGCVSLQFLCKLPGHSRIHIQYGAVNDNLMKTTLVLACHKPIKPISPVRVAVLALGTSKEVAFEGGPRAWPMYKQGHYSKLIPDEFRLVDIAEMKDPVRYNRDLHVFKVLCKKLGETVLNFQVGNKESPTNRSPARLTSSVKIVCGEPAAIHLGVQSRSLKGKKDDEKKADFAVVKVPFYGSKMFEINLWMKDSIGRKFANISSLSIYWEVSNYKLAKPHNYRDVIMHTDGSAGYQRISRNFQEFEMSGDTGSLKVTAKLQGYQKNVLKKMNISNFVDLKEISQSIDIRLISVRENFDNYAMLKQGNTQASEDTCDGDTCHS